MAKNTRDRILQAAASAFLQAGYDTPLTAVLTAAGVSNGSFFHVFKTKRALARTLCETILVERSHRTMVGFREGLPPREAIAAAITGYLHWSGENAPWARLLRLLPGAEPGGGETNGPSPLDQDIATIGHWAAGPIEQGLIQALQAPLLHALIFGAAERAVDHWLGSLSAASPGTLAPILEQAAWAAIKAAPKSNALQRRKEQEPQLQGAMPL